MFLFARKTIVKGHILVMISLLNSTSFPVSLLPTRRRETMVTRLYQIAFIFKSNLVKGPASTTPIFIWSIIYNEEYSTLRRWSRAASECQTWTDFVKRGNKLKKAKRKEIYRSLHDRKNLFAIVPSMLVSGLFAPFPFGAKNVIDSQLKILYNILIGNRFPK